MSGPPWTRRSAWTSPASPSRPAWTRPDAGSFQIPVRTGVPRRSIVRTSARLTDRTELTRLRLLARRPGVREHPVAGAAHRPERPRRHHVGDGREVAEMRTHPPRPV